MHQTKILIASVLKPVDDVRHYRKLARSLVSANKYQIFIIGKGCAKNSGDERIEFLPTGNFDRFSLKRIGAQWTFFQAIKSIRPALVLITTPELLPLASWLKSRYKFKLVFDVQEDYDRNFTHQKEYGYVHKILFRGLLKLTDHTLEKVDHFILAERIYTTLEKYKNRTYTLLENKFLPEDLQPVSEVKIPKSSKIKVLISGTLSPYTNPILGIQFFKKLAHLNSELELIVIGKVLSASYKKQIEQAVNNHSQIKLFLELKEVNYELILNHLHECDYGLIPYLPDPVNESRIPTKLFEFAANGKPFFILENSSWQTFGRELGTAIGVNFLSPDLTKLESVLVQGGKRTLPRVNDKALWLTERDELLNSIERLIY